jgi:hypothetical protein
MDHNAALSFGVNVRTLPRVRRVSRCVHGPMSQFARCFLITAVHLAEQAAKYGSYELTDPQLVASWEGRSAREL